VLPALIRKFHEAKLKRQHTVTLWGSGKPRREFLHADDLADACLFLMQRYDEPGLVNIGVGEDLEIKELAMLIQKIVGYEGQIVHDLSKPDGTFRKLMDVSKLHNLGWKAAISLEEGLRSVYADFSRTQAGVPAPLAQ
jgi:GDP-L-fucose synthase